MRIGHLLSLISLISLIPQLLPFKVYNNEDK